MYKYVYMHICIKSIIQNGLPPVINASKHVTDSIRLTLKVTHLFRQSDHKTPKLIYI